MIVKPIKPRWIPFNPHVHLVKSAILLLAYVSIVKHDSEHRQFSDAVGTGNMWVKLAPNVDSRQHSKLPSPLLTWVWN